MDLTFYYVFHAVVIGSMVLTGLALIILTVIFYKKAQRVCIWEEQEATSNQKEEQSMLPILNAIGLEMVFVYGVVWVVFFILLACHCICVPLLIWSIVKVTKYNNRHRLKGK